jgi:pyridoxal 5'-phosphate synthase pdxT subunit
VLGELEGRPIIVEQGRLLAAAFHPELAGDGRLHRRLLENVG